MISFTYFNPVRIIFGPRSLTGLDTLVGKRKALLVTTQGFGERGVVERMQKIAPQITHVLAEVPPQPTFPVLKELYVKAWQSDFDLIIGLGGGSVLDTAKVLSVKGPSGDFSDVEKIIRSGGEGQTYRLTPVLAIPTTSGTASEVTPWASVWDMEAKKKYSLQLPDLWPETALCDPELTLTLPREITISTGLDALSHSLESIWNRNANPISARFAVRAAKLIMKNLPKLAKDLKNLDTRKQMMFAALSAGLAYSNTQTALAHAISYYVTAHKGVPHGIACSFTLPDILDAVAGEDPKIDKVLLEIFGSVSSRPLRELFSDLGVSTRFSDYRFDQDEVETIQKGLAAVPRTKNSRVPLEKVFQTFSAQFRR